MLLLVRIFVLSWACLLACRAATPRVVQPLWSYQVQGLSPIGPDGPWQAVLVDYTGLVTGGLLASYLDNESSNVVPSEPGLQYPQGNGDTLRASDSWNNFTGVGTGIDTLVSMVAFPGSLYINTTVFVSDSWSIGLPTGRKYRLNAGTLELYLKNSSNILGGLKARGLIDTMSWSTHIGSVPHQLPGSCMLGGYDPNRAIGAAAVSNAVSKSDSEYIDHLFLLDTILGVEKGGSPFPPEEQITATTPRSVWDGARTSNIAAGAPYDAYVVKIRPSSPGIYLPKQTCANIAKLLPVTWRPDIGYYTWNIDDPRYKNIITSPTYLGFVFSDQTTKNITIKVPFPLLNLTLESPIVDTPTPYFPCHPTEAIAVLGRAFLQAAFYAANYETNIAYLAQAPGPRVKQSITQALPSDGSTSLLTLPPEELAKSWDTIWTPLPEIDTSQDNSSSSSGLTSGAIAGIVIGVLVGAGALGSVVLMLWRRKNKANTANTANVTYSPVEKDKRFEADPTSSNVYELPPTANVGDLNIENVRYSRDIGELESK